MMRAFVALIAGLALGLILGGALAFFLLPGGLAASAPSLGDATQPYDLSFTVTETFLQDEVNHPAADSGAKTAPLRDAQVRVLPDGTIQVRGTTTVLGLPVPARVELQPRVVDGQLSVSLLRAQAGAFGLPDNLARQIEDRVNARLRATMAGRPFQIVALQPSAGQLTVLLKSSP